MISELGRFIDNNQSDEFVNHYIKCLNDKYQLTLPVSMDAEELNAKWESVLARFRADFSDEFCKAVSQKWLSLLVKCNSDSETLELDMLTAAGLSIEDISKNEAPLTETTTTEFGIPSKVRSTQDPLTKPEISEKYQQRQLAEEVRLPELAKLNGVYNKAFKSKNAVTWLISHLTFARYNEAKPIPKSTVPASIREHWETIIAKEHDTIADDVFLSEITNEWFYLVNQKGIPVNAHQMEEVLMILLSKQQKVSDIKRPPKPGKKKQGIFKQLFG